MYIGAININATYEALNEASFFFKFFLLSSNLVGFWTKTNAQAPLLHTKATPHDMPFTSAVYWGAGTETQARARAQAHTLWLYRGGCSLLLNAAVRKKYTHSSRPPQCTLGNQKLPGSNLVHRFALKKKFFFFKTAALNLVTWHWHD